METGEDVIRFYGKYGHDSAVKFFYCNRWVPAAAAGAVTARNQLQLMMMP